MSKRRILISLVAIGSFLLLPWYLATLLLLIGNILIEKYWESLIISVGIDLILTGGFIVGYEMGRLEQVPIISLATLVVFLIKNTIFREKN